MNVKIDLLVMVFAFSVPAFSVRAQDSETLGSVPVGLSRADSVEVSASRSDSLSVARLSVVDSLVAGALADAPHLLEPLPSSSAIGELTGDRYVTRRELDEALSPLLRRRPFASRKESVRLDAHLRQTFVAIRTNLLCPATSIGVEVPIGNRWSVAADFYCPWLPRPWMDSWTGQKNAACFQVLAIAGEARVWLGSSHSPSADRKYRLTGHGVGLVGGWGYYDLELRSRGCQGSGVFGGLDYTYAMPAFKGAVNFEFGITLGVLWTRFYPYDSREKTGYLIHAKGETGEQFYFGPLKAQATLVVPIRRKPTYYKTSK